MKIRFSSIIALLIIAGSFSCNKYDFDYPPGTVAGSKIIYFPSIETNGDLTIYLNQGDSYTDAGATAFLNGEPVEYTTSTTVDTNVPNIYNIVYTAVNAEGYSATSWRTVVVIGDDVAGNDYSGSYARDVNGLLSVWTKTAPGIYSVTNPGGAAGYGAAAVIAVNYTGNKIAIPKQISPDLGESSTSAAAWLSPTEYTWSLLIGGFGTQARYFDKQ